NRDLSSLEERARAVRAGLELVAPLEDPVRRQVYARVLAGKVGEPEVSVMLQLERLLAPEAALAGEDHAAKRMPPWQRVEREALKLVIQTPELCSGRIEDLAPDRFA